MSLRSAVRVVVIATLLAPRLAAQSGTPRFYVARLVGSWVVIDSAGTRPLHPLDPLTPSTAIRVDPNARVDTAYEIMVRDPQSLRVAHWRCKPVANCSASYRAAALPFESTTLKTSARTGALFLAMGEDAEERSRVKLVGARGAARDWGLVVLAVDSLKLDLGPLLSLAEGREEDLIVRICGVDPRGHDSAGQCGRERKLGPGDCLLTRGVPCVLSQAVDSSIAVRFDIFARVDSLISEVSIAFAYGLLTSPRSRARLVQQTSAYLHDIDALGPRISPEERMALLEAAARRMAGRAR
jgi:hypothetical protein